MFSSLHLWIGGIPSLSCFHLYQLTKVHFFCFEDHGSAGGSSGAPIDFKAKRTMFKSRCQLSLYPLKIIVSLMLLIAKLTSSKV